DFSLSRSLDLSFSFGFGFSRSFSFDSLDFAEFDKDLLDSDFGFEATSLELALDEFFLTMVVFTVTLDEDFFAAAAAAAVAAAVAAVVAAVVAADGAGAAVGGTGAGDVQTCFVCS
uniref:hypothetical protein n=1 Tax=Salmonella sp. s54925 TaxID=3159674 RepID=UPI00397F189F